MPTVRSALRVAHNTGSRAVLLPVLRYERRNGLPFISERLVEYSTALRWIAERYPSTLLDVGPGEGPWPALLSGEGIDVTAIDEIGSYWQGRFFNRHFDVTRGDITAPRLDRKFELVTCISVLEHIPDHRAAIRGMFSVLAPGGVIVLTCPYNERRYVDNCYELPEAAWGSDASYICRQYSRSELDQWLDESSGEVVEIERWNAVTGETWASGERRRPPLKAGADEPHQLACMLLRAA
jgi:SAM-dependent methyltransferase